MFLVTSLGCWLEEGVLHVAGRVVGGKVHLGEHVQVVLHFRTVGQDKAHTREDVDNLIRHDGQRVACSQFDGVGSTRQVQSVVVALLNLCLLFQGVDALLCQLLQLVNLHAYGFLLVGSHVAEVVHQCRYLTFLAEVFQSQLLYFFSVLRAQVLYFF